MQHRFTLLLLSACIVLGSWAQQVKQDILNNPLLSAGNYLPYPGPDNTALTPAPKGYTPFYLSHYGRHGSRYLIDPHDYTDVMNTLARADSLGLLTPEGQHTLTIVRRMYDESLNRYGELTPLGAEQHKGIAKRMIERFPQIFEGKTNIDARSTVVIRCILSMENELQTLLLANPQLQIKQDASEHDMYYMNFNDTTLFNHRWTPEATSAFQEFSHQHIHGQRLAATLFNDTAYVAQNVDTDKLFSQLFNLTGILPNSDLGRHNSLYPLFTKASSTMHGWFPTPSGTFMAELVRSTGANNPIRNATCCATSSTKPTRAYNLTTQELPCVSATTPCSCLWWCCSTSTDGANRWAGWTNWLMQTGLATASFRWVLTSNWCSTATPSKPTTSS